MRSPFPPTAGTNWPGDSPSGRARSTTRTGSRALSCSSRPTSAPRGSWSPGGATKPRSRPGCTPPRSVMGTARRPSAAAARRRRRSASAASCGPTRLRAARPARAPRLADAGACRRKHKGGRPSECEDRPPWVSPPPSKARKLPGRITRRDQTLAPGTRNLIPVSSRRRRRAARPAAARPALADARWC